MANEKETIDSKSMFPPPSLLTSGPNGKVNNEQTPFDMPQKTLTSAPGGAGSAYYQNVTQKGKLILPTALWVLLIVAGLCFLSLLTTLNKTIGTLDTLVEIEQAKAKSFEKNINEQDNIAMEPFEGEKFTSAHKAKSAKKHPFESDEARLGSIKEDPFPILINAFDDIDNNKKHGDFSESSWFSFPAWTSLEPAHQRKPTQPNHMKEDNFFSSILDDMLEFRPNVPMMPRPVNHPPPAPLPPSRPRPLGLEQEPVESMVIIASGELPQEPPLNAPQPAPFAHRRANSFRLPPEPFLGHENNPIESILNQIFGLESPIVKSQAQTNNRKQDQSFITANIDKININVNPAATNEHDNKKPAKSMIHKQDSDSIQSLDSSIDSLLSKLIDGSGAARPSGSGVDLIEQHSFLLPMPPAPPLSGGHHLNHHHSHQPLAHHHHNHVHSNKNQQLTPLSPISSLLLPLEFSRPSSELISPQPAPLPYDKKLFEGAVNQPPPMFGRPRITPSESLISFSFGPEQQKTNKQQHHTLLSNEDPILIGSIPLGMPEEFSHKKHGSGSPYELKSTPLEQLFGKQNKQQTDDDFINSLAQSLFQAQENNFPNRKSHGAIKSEDRNKQQSDLFGGDLLDTIVLIDGEPKLTSTIGNDVKISSLVENNNNEKESTKKKITKEEKKSNDFEDIFKLFFGPPPSSKLVVKPTTKPSNHDDNNNNVFILDNKPTTTMFNSDLADGNNNLLDKNNVNFNDQNTIVPNGQEPSAQIQNQMIDGQKITTPSMLDTKQQLSSNTIDNKKPEEGNKLKNQKGEMEAQQLMDEFFGSMLSLPQFGKDDQMMKVSEQSSGPKDNNSKITGFSSNIQHFPEPSFIINNSNNDNNNRPTTDNFDFSTTQATIDVSPPSNNQQFATLEQLDSKITTATTLPPLTVFDTNGISNFKDPFITTIDDKNNINEIKNTLNQPINSATKQVDNPIINQQQNQLSDAIIGKQQSISSPTTNTQETNNLIGTSDTLSPSFVSPSTLTDANKQQELTTPKPVVGELEQNQQVNSTSPFRVFLKKADDFIERNISNLKKLISS